MRLDSRAFALAAGTMVAAFFLLCSTAYRIVPDWYARQYTLFMHVDLTKYGRIPGWGEVILGTVGWGVGVAILALLLAGIYNRLART